MSVHGFAKISCIFISKSLHISKDTRSQNIDVREDIFLSQKWLFAFVKESLHNYPTIKGKNFDVFPKSYLTTRKLPSLNSHEKQVFWGSVFIIPQIFCLPARSSSLRSYENSKIGALDWSFFGVNYVKQPLTSGSQVRSRFYVYKAEISSAWK